MSLQAATYTIYHQQPNFGFVGLVTDREVITHVGDEVSILTWTRDYQINGSVHPRLFSFLTSAYMQAKSPTVKSIVDAIIYFIFVRAHEVPELKIVRRVRNEYAINIGVNQGQAYLKIEVFEDNAYRQIVYPIAQTHVKKIKRWFSKRDIQTC